MNLLNRIKTKYKIISAYRKFKKSKTGNFKIGTEQLNNFIIKYPERLKIGNGTVLTGDFFCNAYGCVTIGDYCHIAKGLTIYSHNHNWRSEKSIPYDDINIKKSVYIGNCVWIGCNVTITPGTIIHDGAIISAGSVVFGEIQEGSIVRGNPAIKIGSRNMEIYKQLKSQEHFF